MTVLLLARLVGWLGAMNVVSGLAVVLHNVRQQQPTPSVAQIGVAFGAALVLVSAFIDAVEADRVHE